MSTNNAVARHQFRRRVIARFIIAPMPVADEDYFAASISMARGVAFAFDDYDEIFHADAQARQRALCLLESEPVPLFDFDGIYRSYLISLKCYYRLLVAGKISFSEASPPLAASFRYCRVYYFLRAAA